MSRFDYNKFEVSAIIDGTKKVKEIINASYAQEAIDAFRSKYGAIHIDNLNCKSEWRGLFI